MNGALTISTRDGATIEMAEATGQENLFMFRPSAEEVARSRGWYNPQWHYDNDQETRAARDLSLSRTRNKPWTVLTSLTRTLAPLSATSNLRSVSSNAA